MQIQTFLNGKGLIHGKNYKRIACDRDGVLKVGETEINVSHTGESIMPILFYGATGKYSATFTDVYGATYDLGRLEIRNGRLTPPRQVDVELMEIRCRTDVLEKENEHLKQKIEELSNVFDTNSLNFLIG